MEEKSMEKDIGQRVEYAVESASDTHSPAASLSPEHRDYLLRRHGTVDLDPLPDASDLDPYNWPQWKKVTNLLLVAFHSFMALFAAASIIPAYESIAEDLDITVQTASYLTGVQIAILGGAPLFWKPLARVYGRRPVLIISLVGSLVCNIGAANSPNYGSMTACRALSAWFISPAAAIGSAVVMETFFKEQRARYMGIWTLMVTIGVPFAAFICGFVVYRVSYRWIYYIIAITNGVQLILYFFFGPESRYIRGQKHESLTSTKKYLAVRRIDPEPLRPTEFIRPLYLIASPSAAIPAVAYAMVFLFANIMTTVEIPQLFGPKFHLNAQQIGLQFVALVVGSVLGEQVGGWASDACMAARSRRLGARAPPEFRLYLAYPGFALACAGVAVFLVQTQNAVQGVWNATPVVGAAVAAAGNQIVTTVLITYVVDTHPAVAADVGVFVTFVRQIWGFIGPFWLPQMFETVGLRGSTGIAVGLVVAVAIVPTLVLHVTRRGKRVTSAA